MFITDADTGDLRITPVVFSPPTRLLVERIYQDIAVIKNTQCPRYIRCTSPISMLPVELLTKIFSHLYEDICEDDDLDIESAEEIRIGLTQVCRHWRDVAFHHKELWTRVGLENLRWTMIAIEMSRPLPISIVWDGDVQPSVSALLVSLAELPRTRILHMEAPDGDWIPHFCFVQSALAQLPTPQLEALYLKPSYTLEMFDQELTMAPGGAFALQKLVLTGIVLPPVSPLFLPGLTLLDLDTCDVWESLQQVNDTLSRVPGLQTLRLCDVLPDGKGYSEVHLPNLQELSLSDAAQTVADFLFFLKLPANMAAVTINIDLSPHSGPIVEFVASLEKCLGSSLKEGEFYRTVEFPVDGPVLMFCEPHSSGESSTLPKEFVFSVALPVPLAVVSPDHWLGTIALQMMLRVRFFRPANHWVICREYVGSSRAWLEVLAGYRDDLEHVRELDLFGEAVFGLLDAVGTLGITGLFRGLSSLRIGGVDLGNTEGTARSAYVRLQEELTRHRQAVSGPFDIFLYDCVVGGIEVDQLLLGDLRPA